MLFTEINAAAAAVFQKKHVATSSMITWTRIVHLQQFLAHLLLRV